MKNEIFCTLGPSSLNKKFLSFAQKNKVTLVRLNMSHLNIRQLKNVFYLLGKFKFENLYRYRRYQIRTKIKTKSIKIKK